MDIKSWTLFKRAFGTPTQRLGRIDAEIKGLLEELGALVELGEARDDLSAALDEVHYDRLVEDHRFLRAGFEGATSSEQESRIRDLQAMKPVLLGHIRTLWPLLNGDLPRLLEQKGGSKVLDRFVEASDDEAFVKQALRARYALETLSVTDGTSAATLKKLYKVSQLVPDSHTRGNRHIEELRFKRMRSKSDGGYSMGRIRIDVTFYFEKRGVGALDHDATVLPEDRPSGGLEPLMGMMCHEVGHAVSVDLSIMNSHWGEPEYGGWLRASAGELAAKLVEHKGIGACELDEDLVVAMLTELITAGHCSWDTSKADVQARADIIPKLEQLQVNPTLLKAAALAEQWAQPGAWPDEDTHMRRRNELVSEPQGNPKDDQYLRNNYLLPFFSNLIDDMLKRGADTNLLIRDHHRRSQVYKIPMSDTQRAALLASDAGKTAKWVFDKGRAGLYRTKAKGAERLALGGRVYTYGNDKRYYSYDPEARRTGVSAYQFNAPEEWFAELYAFYYSGKLPDGHPGITHVLSHLPTE
ncbi:MAG: hypothetical protein H6741_08270 [Alphaproteobacteria bacterium]|nr:hypothetical protein [Alphaproteobacteria bacterium]MCB9792713.1 hypothetical protein [Alphaproteobacteria bacterium]